MVCWRMRGQEICSIQHNSACRFPDEVTSLSPPMHPQQSLPVVSELHNLIPYPAVTPRLSMCHLAVSAPGILEFIAPSPAARGAQQIDGYRRWTLPTDPIQRSNGLIVPGSSCRRPCQLYPQAHPTQFQHLRVRFCGQRYNRHLRNSPDLHNLQSRRHRHRCDWNSPRCHSAPPTRHRESSLQGQNRS